MDNQPNKPASKVTIERRSGLFSPYAAQRFAAYAKKGSQMGKRDPLQDMRVVSFDIVVTLGGCIDL